MKRLFCAVKAEAGEEIRSVWRDFRDRLGKERINWVDPAGLHITLAFFGDTPPNKEAQITKALEQAAGHSSPFSFQARGCGTFGSRRMPRVIWLGTREADGFTELHEQVIRFLEPTGYRPDKKVFVPHLTIGRIKHLEHPGTLDELVSAYQDKLFGTFSVDRFYLIQSVLTPGGPVYRTVQSFEL